MAVQLRIGFFFYLCYLAFVVVSQGGGVSAFLQNGIPSIPTKARLHVPHTDLSEGSVETSIVCSLLGHTKAAAATSFLTMLAILSTAALVPTASQAAPWSPAPQVSEPLVQVLVQFEEKQRPWQEAVPDPSAATLYVTAETPEEGPGGRPGRAVAGAKVPLARLRPPVLLQLFEENLLVPPAEWGAAGDLWVEARVCPRPAPPRGADCAPSHAGRGLAKYVDFMEGIDPLRAPASVVLKEQ
ncbi:unnamed protein product [Heterosigma akashiwo]|mmetsp:Transcript_2195/g.2995  ORF Transcript_2195/g.2995 Transcript_2195/m.2995 type:complete len:241 (-) Transcript_2195:281-1003(-)